MSNPEHQKIKFTFGQDNTQGLIAGLKEEKYDSVICSYVDNEPDIDFVQVAQEELVLIVSNDHPLAKFNSINLEETVSYPYVSFTKDSGLRVVIDNVLKSVNIAPNVAFETETDRAVAGLVEINLGIAIIPKMHSLKNLNVKVLKITNPIGKRLIYIANMKNRSSTASIDSFNSFVINYVKENIVKI